MSNDQPISKLYPVNDLVIAMGQMQLQGDIIPHEWYSKITHENGKPDPVAVALLAHVVYWYRPVELLEVARPVWYKKFASDLLQKSYEDLQNHFGFSRKQLLLAFRTLERLGLAQRILRTIYVGSQKNSNVMFVEIFPKKIAQISNPTFELKKKVPSCRRRQEGGVMPLKAIGGAVEGKTNTETTTETTKSLDPDLSPYPFRESQKPQSEKKRSGRSLGSKKEPISLNDSRQKLQIRWKLSDQQYDTLQWLQRIRSDHEWLDIDDGFLIWMASNFHKDALQRAIASTADRNPDRPGAWLRTVLKNQSESIEDKRSFNFNLLKAFKEKNQWDSLEIGKKSAWYIDNGIKQEIDLIIDYKDFELFLKMRYDQWKRHKKNVA